MEIYRFDAEVGRKIDQHGSINFFLSPIVNLQSEARLSCIHLGRNGLIGFHPADSPQLLLVMDGQGWVRAGDAQQIPVRAGNAVFWRKGEWHETGTVEGLTALVIESDPLDPAELMPAR